MFRNWSKIILVSTLVLMVAASLSFATTARVRSLAHTGDYMSDDSNAYRWYSVLPQYANQVNAEVGTYTGSGSLSDSRGLGWNHACGDEGKWGTYRITLNENALDHNGFWMINPFQNEISPGAGASNLGDGSFEVTPINTYDLAGGWEIGENMALGVAFTRSRASWESTGAPDSSRTRTWTTIGAGFTWTNNEDITADLLFNFGMAGGEDKLGAAATRLVEWDSKNAIDIAGRLFYDWTDEVTVPVKAEFITADYSLKRAGTPGNFTAPEGDKLSAFQLGVGINMDVNQDHMLIFAIEFANAKWEYSRPDTTDPAPTDLAEISWTYLPTFRLALESSINSWLTTRVGAARHMIKTTQKSADGKEIKQTDGASDIAYFVPWVLSETPPAAFEWFLGVGFNVAEWTIDMELAHETPFSIGYWLTGYSAFSAEDEGPVGRIAATYNY
ncbi:MAG: hypothetical protein OEO21_04320 [Candidatus Krumholzibacteria bacterium]|nr:hypothetical protein [Candidatus Krumholzibacteria bacterium]